LSNQLGAVQDFYADAGEEITIWELNSVLHMIGGTDTLHGLSPNSQLWRKLVGQKFDTDCSDIADSDVLDFFESATAIGGKVGYNIINLATEGSRYSYLFSGYFRPTATSWFDFKTMSDDGSWVFIDGNIVVNNRGSHGPKEESGSFYMTAGTDYKIEIPYGQGGGGVTMIFSWRESGGAWSTSLSGSKVSLEERSDE